MRSLHLTGKEVAMKALSGMLKIIIVAVLTASVLLLSVGCAPKTNEDYERECAELIYKKQMLIRERDNLVPNMEASLGNTSYMSFIFTGLDSALYTDVYPVLSEGDVRLVGVMAFSVNELPGLEGNVTREQYDELVSYGWGSALYWNGELPLEEFILEMKTMLDGMNIELPSSLMFAEGLYSYSYDALLLEYGVLNAVHGAESEADTVEKNEPTGVWHPGCIEWRRLGVSTKLKHTVETGGGYSLFEVGFDTADTEKNVRASYFPIDGRDSDANRTAVFARMIAQFKESVKKGDIEVLNVDDTRAEVAKYYSEKRAIEAANALRAAEIEEEIRKVEHQITELYVKYH